ncbi:MAG: hypothetical protein H6707_16270 [Deltaproteobacteria bacterium]|nr:hypothetical protein [Deltaproteobacteria bacterium]
MAELRLLPLDEVLDAKEIVLLSKKLAEQGIDDLPEGEDVIEFDAPLSEEQLDDFMDRLAAHDIACSIYLPLEFDETVDIPNEEAEHKSVGSVHRLLEALEELREELDVDSEVDEDEEEDEDEEPVDLELVDEQLSYAWRVFARAAVACANRQIPLHVIH